MVIIVSAEISQTLLPDGTKLVIYPNGNRKEIWPNGKGIQVIYYNGDIKQKLSDGSIIYTYADSGTKHTTKSDGTEILEFRRFSVLLITLFIVDIAVITMIVNQKTEVICV